MAARDRLELLPVLTSYRRPKPAPSRIESWLLAAGVRLVETPAGWRYGDCPTCGTFAGLTLDADGHRWRASCGCYGRRPLGEPEAAALFHRLIGHVA